MGKESEISVKMLNQFTHRITNGLDKETINELIEVFKSHLRRNGNPWRTNYNCPGQKILMLPESQMYRATEIFQPIIDKLSKNKHGFMKYFTEDGFDLAGF